MLRCRDRGGCLERRGIQRWKCRFREAAVLIGRKPLPGGAGHALAHDAAVAVEKMSNDRLSRPNAAIVTAAVQSQTVVNRDVARPHLQGNRSVLDVMTL